MIKNFLITIFAILSLTITTKAFAQDDINCLAKAIYFESKGGLERDMKDVGHVVLNRTNHSKFPSDVCSVVYQRTPRVCQFSWVCTTHRVKEHQEFQKSLVYARELLEQEKTNTRRDTTNGALFFRVTSKKSGACHVNKQHAFFK